MNNQAQRIINGIPVPLVRANQYFIVVMVLLALFFRSPWPVALVTAVLLVGLAGGGKVHPVFVVTRRVYGSRLKSALKEDADAQRFNLALAVIFFGLSLVGFFLLHSAWLAWGAAGLVGLLALAGTQGY